MIDNGKLGWFLAGAAIGATAALLLAPGSGEDTREYLGQAAHEGKDAVTSSSREMMERGKELYDRGRELAEDAAELFERGRKLMQG
jgi:gas vesicle protein